MTRLELAGLIGLALTVLGGSALLIGLMLIAAFKR